MGVSYMEMAEVAVAASTRILPATSQGKRFYFRRSIVRRGVLAIISRKKKSLHLRFSTSAGKKRAVSEAAAAGFDFPQRNSKTFPIVLPSFHRQACASPHGSSPETALHTVSEFLVVHLHACPLVFD
mmetsp:Transcript_3094/g.7176  ORF Transcript_3094/g.7176 Transcript_3094/m.7176 type:complete len:127 (-) Transcript_3094:369-749(-)